MLTKSNAEQEKRSFAGTKEPTEQSSLSNKRTGAANISFMVVFRGVQCTEKCECTIMVYFFPSWNKWVTYSYNTEWLNIKVKNESQFEKTVCYPGWSVCESLVVYSGCLSRTVAKMSLLILDSISNWKLEILSSQSGFLTGTKGVLTDPQVRPDFAIQDGNKGHKR